MWFRSPADDDAVHLLIEMAKIDWMDISNLAYDVGRRIGLDAPIEAVAAATGELVGILIDHDVVPGDLGSHPDFDPWPGTKQERVTRIIDATIALGRHPLPAEIAWFHYEPDAD